MARRETYVQEGEIFSVVTSSLEAPEQTRTLRSKDVVFDREFAALRGNQSLQTVCHLQSKSKYINE